MKPENYSSLQSRRAFIRQAACAAVGTAALSSTLRDMRFLNSAVAQSNATGYKALICVFLNGGNDSNNLIIPTIPSEWDSYATARTPVLAIPNADTGPATAQALTSMNGQPGFPALDGHTYGFHPAMIELARLFNQTNTPPYNAAKVATMLNVGTLSYPLTKAQAKSGSVPKPPQLFSHSDQQVQWQTSIPDKPPISGWGGRIADLLTTPVDVNAGGQISMAITLAGSNKFEVGDLNAAAQYSVTTSGAVNITSGISGARLTTLQSIMNTDKALPDLQTGAYGKVLDHAVAEAGLVSNALAGNASAPWLSYFPTNVTTPNGGATFSSSLMSQMKMVARLLDAGKRNYIGNVSGTGFGMKRQIFFVQVGGYDTHTGQTANAGATTTDNAKVIIGQQANLLAELSQSLNALMKAMTDLGMVNEVTAFTVSDFARTFRSNGLGSDHSWGGHQIVVGGAVKGGATYGKFPALVVNGPDDYGGGSWVPTMAVDQYAAELASWFGVDSGNLSTIFPNLGRFGRMSVPFI
jgi:uncharacterized protein (DUF1501 family)